jgi:hypothetical protein
MQRNWVLFLASVLVCTALFYTVSNVFAMNSGLQSFWSNQPAQQQYQITGVIQAKNGNMWTIDGKNYTVDLASVQGGSSNVGDTIELTVSRSKTAADVQPSNTPDPNATPSPSETPSPGSTPMKKGEATGVVTAIDANSITIDGVVYKFSTHTEIGNVNVGDTVKVEYFTAADGTLTAYEVEMAESSHTETEMSEPKSTHESDDDHGSSNSGQSQESGDYEDDDDHDSSSMGQYNGSGDHDGDEDSNYAGDNHSGGGSSHKN